MKTQLKSLTILPIDRFPVESNKGMGRFPRLLLVPLLLLVSSSLLPLLLHNHLRTLSQAATAAYSPRLAPRG